MDTDRHVKRAFIRAGGPAPPNCDKFDPAVFPLLFWRNATQIAPRNFFSNHARTLPRALCCDPPGRPDWANRNKFGTREQKKKHCSPPSLVLSLSLFPCPYLAHSAADSASPLSVYAQFFIIPYLIFCDFFFFLETKTSYIFITILPIYIYIYACECIVSISSSHGDLREHSTRAFRYFFIYILVTCGWPCFLRENVRYTIYIIIILRIWFIMIFNFYCVHNNIRRLAFPFASDGFLFIQSIFFSCV